MLNKELQVEIDVLHRQGKGIRTIARETGIARNTIRAILAGKSDGQYGPRRARPTKLDAYKGYLLARIEAAGKIQLPATVLLREIRADGYKGGITQLKEYLRAIRPTPPDEPIIRFETEPGRQLQIDFVVFRRGEQPLRAFTAELGFSRYSYVEFTNNESGTTLGGLLGTGSPLLRRRAAARSVRQPQDDRDRTERLRRGIASLSAGLAGFR
jgi:transposase